MERLPISPTINLYQPAIIKTEGVVELRDEIQKLSEEMVTVDVTEENLQHYKKLLAEVRKKWQAVDRQRIDIKKEVLEPYSHLDSELKTIREILEKGESHIKHQIDELAEKERLERLTALRELFDKQHKAYYAPNWLTFEKFLLGRETLVNNKTTSQRKKITAITDFFNNYNKDYKLLKDSYEFEDDRTAILLSYSTNGYNMIQAIDSYKAMKAEKERLEALQKERIKKPKIGLGVKPVKQPVDKKLWVEISEKDLPVLEEHGIIYKVIKK